MAYEDPNQMPSSGEEFTIVIPVYNREKLVIRTLNSVRSQSYRPLRLIVVDNNSTDGTREVVERWIADNRKEDFRIDLYVETKPGASSARNRGLREVTSPHMSFFDSDDVMATEMVTTLMREFDRDPKLDIFYWRTARINSREEVMPLRFYPHNVERGHFYNAMLATESYAARTQFFRDCGGWNESLHGWDDWELGIRLLLNAPRMKGTWRILTYIYPQEESITGVDYHSKAGEWERALDIVEQIAEDKEGRVAETLRKVVAYRRVNLAALYTLEGHPELGEPLRDMALERSGLSPRKKKLLKLIYKYTSRGGRGAYLIWR